MPSILDKIVDHKKQEIANAKKRISLGRLREQLATAPTPRNFLNAIRKSPAVSLIAEVKKASPSKGVIRKDFDPVSIAKTYASHGASCVSVLTDETFFQGHLDFLATIRQQIEIPILRKDFVIDPYQIYEARVAGADAVLLIAECLQPQQLRELHDEIASLDMTPLVEFYNPKNLPVVLAAQPKLVGINNRDLNTFETDLTHCIRLRHEIPADVTVVGESGVFTHADVSKLAEANIDAMLVGESLMKSENIGAAVRNLLNPEKP